MKPYLDERALLAANIPETREYRMCWWDKSEASGDFCPLQKVTVGG